jgi:threonyl-tRNA synthetase
LELDFLSGYLKGQLLEESIERYITDKELSLGYMHVYTPIMANG